MGPVIVAVEAAGPLAPAAAHLAARAAAGALEQPAVLAGAVPLVVAPLVAVALVAVALAAAEVGAAVAVVGAAAKPD